MTPKDKAEELVDKFYKSLRDDLDYESAEFYDIKGDAKQCALICVEEIIKNIKLIYKITVPRGSEQTRPYIWLQRDYWHEVKEEINKL